MKVAKKGARLSVSRSGVNSLSKPIAWANDPWEKSCSLRAFLSLTQRIPSLSFIVHGHKPK